MGENRIMCDLYEENQRLKARIKELEDKHYNECAQIAHYDNELKEAKRLLKAAVEDMSEKNFCAKMCKRDNFACRVSNTCDFKWRYADEALKLIERG